MPGVGALLGNPSKMGTNDDDIDDLQKLYAELQAEIDFFVAKDKGYIDPTALSAIERRLLVRSVFLVH